MGTDRLPTPVEHYTELTLAYAKLCMTYDAEQIAAGNVETARQQWKSACARHTQDLASDTDEAAREAALILACADEQARLQEAERAYTDARNRRASAQLKVEFARDVMRLMEIAYCNR